MKPYKKAYSLAAAFVLFAIFGWIVPAGGLGLVITPILMLHALVLAGFGVIGQFGSAKKKRWIEDNF